MLVQIAPPTMVDSARPIMTPTTIYPTLSSVFTPLQTASILPPVVPAPIAAMSMQPYHLGVITPPPFAFMPYQQYMPLPQLQYQLFNAFGLPNSATGLQTPPFPQLHNIMTPQPIYNAQNFGELLGAFGEDLDAN